MGEEIEVIRLERIDELLEDYKTFKNKGESFSSFIRVSKLIEDDRGPIFDWEVVDEENSYEVMEDDFGNEIKWKNK